MHDWSFDEVKKKIDEAGFTLPYIVKPDVGMKGILFRKIDSEDQLEKYHERIPVEYIVQDLFFMVLKFGMAKKLLTMVGPELFLIGAAKT